MGITGGKMGAKLVGVFRRIWRRSHAASLVLLGGGLLGGCAALGLQDAKAPVTISEVIQMTDQGVRPESIIARMHDTKTVYRLNAAELAQLHDRGVADPVINH